MNEKQIWSILEIEPTDDVEAIREAYRVKLVNTNPEDDQEGFMALKEAYDEAMRLAEGGNEEEEAELSETMKKVDAIYSDITKRLDVRYWDELFASPEFQSIDEQETIRHDFLNYTMENYKYSTEIWKKIDSVMTIVRDADNLSEQFPGGFISFIVDAVDFGTYVLEEPVIVGRENGIKEINEFPIESDQDPIEGAEYKYEVDEYINLLEKLIREYKNIDNTNISDENRAMVIDRLGADILMLRQYDYYHPNEEIAVIKYLYYKERYEECFRLAEAAVKRTVMTGEKHADFYYSHLVFMYLRFFMQAAHREMGLTVSPEVLAKCREVTPKTMDEIYVNETHAAMSLICYLEGKSKEAADYMSYMANYQRQSKVYIELSNQIDVDRMEELPAKIEAEPDNLSYKISLAWVYSRNDKTEEAYELVKDEVPEGDERLDYYFFVGRYYMDKGEFDKAVEYLQKWKEVLLEKYDPDIKYNLDEYSIREVRDICRIPFAYYMIGVAYFDMRDLDSAKEYATLSLKYAGTIDYYDFARLYDAILELRKEYEEGVDFWSKEIDKNNDYIVICRGNRQYMAYKANRAREVIDDYFYLRYNDPQYADSYMRAEDIYLDYNDMEGFEECLEFIKQNEVSDIRLDFNYGRYLRAKKQFKEAMDIFKEIEPAIEEDNIIDTPSRFYVSYGYCLMDIVSEDKEYISEEDFKNKMLELIDKAKAYDDGNINAYWLDVDYRERHDREYDLKPLYEEMREKFPKNGAVDYELGVLYKKEDEMEKAGELFESGIEKAPRHINLHYALSDYYNDYRYKKLEQIEYSAKAVEVAEKLVELDYEGASAVQYALILMDAMEYDTALEFLNKAVEDFPDDEYVINARGLLYMHTGVNDKAEADFKKAMEVHQGSNRFVAYTNLAKLYEKQNRCSEGAQAYLNYMEKFDQHMIGNYNRLADLYDRARETDKAIDARLHAIALTIQDITGQESGTDIEFSVNKIADKYPDVPIEKFIGLIDYMYDISSSYSIAGKEAEMEAVDAENDKFIERINLLRDIEEMPEGSRGEFAAEIWSVAHHYTFTRRNPEIAAIYYNRYVEVREKTTPEVRYLDSICQAYDLLSRTYLFMGDAEKAAEAGRKAIECIEKSHGSIENYLSFKRYSPLYLCRMSGIYIAIGEKEKAMECLERIDSCKRCGHCSYSYCVDKTDRFGMYAELDGDYEKALEYYLYGQERAGYETEKVCGIRECKKRLQK